MESVGTVEDESLLPAVEERARDSGFSTCSTDVAQLAGAAEDMEPRSVYLVVEGHRATSQVTWSFPENVASVALASLPALSGRRL
jgi:hypothetical protein